VVERFYWLIENSIAGCSRPGGPDRPPAHNTTRPDDNVAGTSTVALEDDLAWLRQQGIGAVLTLTETPLNQAVLDRHGLEVLHLPVPDLTAPFPEEFDRALAFIDRQRMMGRAVAVHCLVGQGRTATVLAAYLVRSGASAADAIAELRALCPGAIGSPGQEHALHAFARRRDWMV
jgi:atypical dual specificity phosphatase